MLLTYAQSRGSWLKKGVRNFGAGHGVSCRRDWRRGLKRPCRASSGKIGPYADPGSSKPGKNEQLPQKYQWEVMKVKRLQREGDVRPFWDPRTNQHMEWRVFSGFYLVSQGQVWLRRYGWESWQCPIFLFLLLVLGTQLSPISQTFRGELGSCIWGLSNGMWTEVTYTALWHMHSFPSLSAVNLQVRCWRSHLTAWNVGSNKYWELNFPSTPPLQDCSGLWPPTDREQAGKFYCGKPLQFSGFLLPAASVTAFSNTEERKEEWCSLGGK